MKEYKVEKIERLDKAVTELEKELSRANIQKMIENGNILVNGETKRNSYKLNIGDIISVNDIEPEKTYLKPQEMPLDIIYEDNDILIINKDKGVVVHPGNGNREGTLVNGIVAKYENSLSGVGGAVRPGIVHRIDKDTSGLIIIAKNDSAHLNISKQIQERKVKKTYIALVRGIIKENEATINMPIGRSVKERTKMAVTKNGKEAITHFSVLNRYSEGYTLIKVNIETGRTHQIRVHMAEIGYPIVGDETYSNGKNPFGVKGQCLHSARLEFKHPTTNKNVEFEAPLPQYFEDIIKSIGKMKLRGQTWK